MGWSVLIRGRALALLLRLLLTEPWVGPAGRRRDDRPPLVHHAEVIALKGDSYRLKDRDLGRVPAAIASED